jgi:FkbM family methyltransferase
MFLNMGFKKQQQTRIILEKLRNERMNKVNQKIKEHNDKIRAHNQNKNKYSSELYDKLTSIQNSLKLDYGTFLDEYPEQMMVVRYLTGNEKVLEIGGNIGRNSLVIASILNKNNNNNFISLECDEEISKQLIHNKNINNLDFFIESSALSKRKLIQKSWQTVASDELLDGYKTVNTINITDLNKKYNIEFDTLVLDCEGAFYYILQDFPEILNNIKLIIMENDYNNINHKIYIDEILKNNNFNIYHSERGGWGPCYTYFFETWIKI